MPYIPELVQIKITVHIEMTHIHVNYSVNLLKVDNALQMWEVSYNFSQHKYCNLVDFSEWGNGLHTLPPITTLYHLPN